MPPYITAMTLHIYHGMTKPSPVYELKVMLPFQCQVLMFRKG